jgi:ribose 5-phosphate isomerase B
MRIAFGTDEDTPTTESVVRHLTDAGHQVVRVAQGERWADVGRAVGEAVSHGDVDRGVVCCWTGTGVSMAANKVDGVRAALCADAETARGARRWNDANVAALSLRSTTGPVAHEILDAFLSTDPDGSEADQVARLR